MQNEIIKIANECEWNFGEKIIKVYSERQGLRKHIIQCGDLTELYKAVVILEDDISVSPFFFEYVLQAVQFYGEDENIAGISLYKHEINVGCSCFFEPDYNGYDTFLMQFAQSWGQCWTYRMWKDFKQWYIKNELNVFEEKNSDLMKNIPSNIKNWGNQSWLKYYMVYLVEKDLYFVYPYHALSTNHSEVGQHNFYTNSDYQISLSSGEKEYKFPRVKEAVKYDIYFERVNYKVPKYENKRIIFDLYGKKRDFSKGEL
ncbi:glycosyltransferase family 2 protein [Coprococcus sp. AF21-14LB]|uniref:glycosyltransferase family 2 protein n=1 Tax=Coprococcus sp. AF21-14LB TaxID=2292231 RepID=UPI000E5346A8|nr:glycosyltransferase family 2 protein [Coprococcus sp. AF21-14LB]RGS74951.1 glycosyltransferase family 2 protein [Coprococcus sp. AF21-14LB]